MESLIIQFTENEEKKRIHIVVERLVIQKQLRDVAQVLAVHLLLQSIDFKHGEFAVAVNLISWWMAYPQQNANMAATRGNFSNRQTHRDGGNHWHTNAQPHSWPD